ncbi:hypothetical protein Asi02nite_03810 [Asanoa siamensis]|uniref:Uncharacterized protein n=1 Tax=Asanoa siamensis TaxID=926357 RepID=A0ABQ4CHT5_9ACTN|nr:hypothetical protein Asi02nite_03810 [Asanoa siamensis]
MRGYGEAAGVVPKPSPRVAPRRCRRIAGPRRARFPRVRLDDWASRRIGDPPEYWGESAPRGRAFFPPEPDS